MPIEEDRSLDVENGLKVFDDNLEGPFYTGGPSSPVGQNLGQGSIYAQNVGDRVIFWQKFGAGANDWRIYPSQDVSYDVSNLIENSAADLIGLNNTKQVVDALAERNYGKDFSSSTRVATVSQTGTTFNVYDTLNVQVSQISTATNRYRLEANFTWRHSSAARDCIVQLVSGAAVIRTQQIEPKDPQADQRITSHIVNYFDNLPFGVFPVSIQFAASNNGTTATFFESHLAWWRVQ